MQKIPLSLAALLLGAGCLVRSLHPWLSAETRVDEPSLRGGWYDARGRCAAFFTAASDSDYAYDVLLVDDDKDLSRFGASLHKLDEHLVLAVGPRDPENLNGCVLLPGYLLLKVDLDGEALKLYGIDLETFPGRAEQAQLALAPGGSPNDGYVLAGDVAATEAFVRAQLADPAFFDEKPLYSFRKLPVSAE